MKGGDQFKQTIANTSLFLHLWLNYHILFLLYFLTLIWHTTMAQHNGTTQWHTTVFPFTHQYQVKNPGQEEIVKHITALRIFCWPPPVLPLYHHCCHLLFTFSFLSPTKLLPHLSHCTNLHILSHPGPSQLKCTTI